MQRFFLMLSYWDLPPGCGGCDEVHYKYLFTLLIRTHSKIDHDFMWYFYVVHNESGDNFYKTKSAPHRKTILYLGVKLYLRVNFEYIIFKTSKVYINLCEQFIPFSLRNILLKNSYEDFGFLIFNYIVTKVHSVLTITYV